MNADAANDSGADIAAGLALLIRVHRAHLQACRWYMQRVAMVQGGVIALCLALVVAACLMAGERDGMARALMGTCAVLNLVTVFLCLRTVLRVIREVGQEARDVRCQLRRIEAEAAEFEACREAAEKTLTAEHTRSVCA